MRKAIVTDATTSEITLFVTRPPRRSRPSTFVAPPVVHRGPDLLDEVVLRLEEPEATAAVRQVVHVARHGVAEVVHLVDHRRDERAAMRARSRPARSGRSVPAATPRA